MTEKTLEEVLEVGQKLAEKGFLQLKFQVFPTPKRIVAHDIHSDFVVFYISPKHSKAYGGIYELAKVLADIFTSHGFKGTRPYNTIGYTVLHVPFKQETHGTEHLNQSIHSCFKVKGARYC